MKIATKEQIRILENIGINDPETQSAVLQYLIELAEIGLEYYNKQSIRNSINNG